MVEADYRMKLIGIGLEKPPVKLVSYVDRAKPSDVSRNAMQRWFFVPDYKCVRESDDKLAHGTGRRRREAGRRGRSGHGRRRAQGAGRPRQQGQPGVRRRASPRSIPSWPSGRPSTPSCGT